MGHDRVGQYMDHCFLCSKPATVLAHLWKLEQLRCSSRHLHQNNNDVPGASLVRRIHRRCDPFNASTLGMWTCFHSERLLIWTSSGDFRWLQCANSSWFLYSSWEPCKSSSRSIFSTLIFFSVVCAGAAKLIVFHRIVYSKCSPSPPIFLNQQPRRLLTTTNLQTPLQETKISHVRLPSHPSTPHLADH